MKILIFCSFFIASILSASEIPELKVISRSKKSQELLLNNSTDKSIFLFGWMESGTFPYCLEVKTDGKWIKRRLGWCAGSDSGIIELKPGEKKTFTVHQPKAELDEDVQRPLTGRIVLSYGFTRNENEIAYSIASEELEVYLYRNGFVPDKKTAIQIAEAVWIPIYGKENIEKERPFEATLTDGVWTVSGALPKDHVGGVAIAEISKEDGRIIRISHGK